VAGIPPFIVMDVMRAANERAAAGADVLHLEVGQPSTGALPGSSPRRSGRSGRRTVPSAGGAFYLYAEYRALDER
jgi:hypothetical protein